jgi:hypothetical protein
LDGDEQVTHHIIHYTLSTGDVRMSPRGEVGEDVIATCRPWLYSGWHRLPIPGYRLLIAREWNALLATVYTTHDEGDRPCVRWGIAADQASADSLWPTLERAYLVTTDQRGFRAADFAAPRRPASTPWIAAYTMLATPEEALWIADLERCLAWALMEEIRGLRRPRK